MSDYDRIRTAIGTILIIIVFLIIFFKKRKSGEKIKIKVIFILIAVFYAFEALIYQFPVENFFMTFSTPQEVSLYTYGSYPDYAIEGNESCLMIKRTGSNESSLRIAAKDLSNNNWKICRDFFDIKHIYFGSVDNYGIAVYRYKKTNDYFVFVTDHQNSLESVEDNYGSEFASFCDYDTYHHNEYFAYVSGFDIDEYRIILDGKSYSLS